MLDSVLTIDKGFYQLAPHVCISTDVEVFETLIRDVNNQPYDKRMMSGMVQKLVTIYRDGFATGWYDDWIEEKRRYYQALFEKVTLKQR